MSKGVYIEIFNPENNQTTYITYSHFITSAILVGTDSSEFFTLKLSLTNSSSRTKGFTNLEDKQLLKHNTFTKFTPTNIRENIRAGNAKGLYELMGLKATLFN